MQAGALDIGMQDIEGGGEGAQGQLLLFTIKDQAVEQGDMLVAAEPFRRALSR